MLFSEETGLQFPGYVPVLIVGGGPVGLLQALLLSRLQIKSLIVERRVTGIGVPKAHTVSPRSLEICRQFELGSESIRRRSSSSFDVSWVNFVTNLSGQSIGRFPYERTDHAVLEHTPEMIHNTPQSDLERYFMDLVSEDANIEVRKGVSFYYLDQSENEVMTTVKERATDKLFHIRSRHVIACDGKQSKVRHFLDIPTEGDSSEQTMMAIHFNANLRPIVNDRVGTLYWILDPVGEGLIVAYGLGENQVHVSQVDVLEDPIELWTTDMCRRKVVHAIGKDIPFEILSCRPWVSRREIATIFQDGNVFLAGDAAHTFPPHGTLGLNCGIADAHNLAHKIALVHKGVATRGLLSTYTPERRSVANLYAKRAAKSGEDIFKILHRLRMRNVDVEEEEGEQPELARKHMSAYLDDPGLRARIEEEIGAQRFHFDNLDLHIGYIYNSKQETSATKSDTCTSNYTPGVTPGARLPHAWISLPSSFSSEASSSSSSTTTINNSSASSLSPVNVPYVTETDPETDPETGSESDSDSENKPKSRYKTSSIVRRWSTLDLCLPDSITVILLSATASEANRRPEQQQQQQQQQQLRHKVGNRNSDGDRNLDASSPPQVTATTIQEQFKNSRLKVNVWLLGRDFHFVDPEREGIFLGGSAGLGPNDTDSNRNDDGTPIGLVVRPDQHILGIVRRGMSVENVSGLVGSYLLGLSL